MDLRLRLVTGAPAALKLASSSTAVVSSTFTVGWCRPSGVIGMDILAARLVPPTPAACLPGASLRVDSNRLMSRSIMDADAESLILLFVDTSGLRGRLFGAVVLLVD